MEKINKLRELLEQNGIDGLLVTSGVNRRYLTGFTGSAGTVVITKTAAVLFVDFRYVEQAQNQAKGFTIQVLEKASIFEEVANLTKNLESSKLGFEQKNITYYSLSKYQEKVKAEMVPVSDLVEKLRMIKTEDEIRKIKTAADITDAAFAHILEFIRPGVTELDVSNELEFHMRKLGASSSAYDTIVASGHRGALPHGVASTKVIEKGDMVTIDVGAYYEGYRADLTRTIAVGEPKEELKGIYTIVYDALSKALEGIKPGITGKQADAFSRDYITEKGYGDKYGHGSGHGIGLDIHEEIFMSPKCEQWVEPGMVLTVEPGIYLPGLGGIRIEDDIVITASGNEVITKSPKELMIL
ncbi:MAG: M24 family metallopeptidase [Heyndrickxia sp.]